MTAERFVMKYTASYNWNEVKNLVWTTAEMIDIMKKFYKDSKEAEAWKFYSEELENWWCKHKDDPTSMEAGMMRPNKPGYFRANND